MGVRVFVSTTLNPLKTTRYERFSSLRLHGSDHIHHKENTSYLEGTLTPYVEMKERSTTYSNVRNDKQEKRNSLLQLSTICGKSNCEKKLPQGGETHRFFISSKKSDLTTIDTREAFFPST